MDYQNLFLTAYNTQINSKHDEPSVSDPWLGSLTNLLDGNILNENNAIAILTNLLTTLDADHNGEIDFIVDKDSFIQELFELIKSFDVDNDGNFDLTKEEIFQLLLDFIKQKQEEESRRSEFDANNDGILDAHEREQMMLAIAAEELGLSPEQLAFYLRMMDVDIGQLFSEDGSLKMDLIEKMRVAILSPEKGALEKLGAEINHPSTNLKDAEEKDLEDSEMQTDSVFDTDADTKKEDPIDFDTDEDEEDTGNGVNVDI